MSSVASPAEDDLIDDLKRFAHSLNKTPTYREFTKYGPHSASKYEQEFGSWNAALRAADLDPNLTHNISSEEIKKDIERVAGVLDRSPTLNEMDRFGKYSLQTYSKKLNSYVETLEQLELDPEPHQYNLSKQAPPDKKQGTKNVRKLREFGPLPSSDLPHSCGVKDKKHGMANFSINTGQHGTPESVYYLIDEHDPVEILRIFFKIHPNIFENRSVSSITQDVGKYGQSWKKAAQTVINSKYNSEPLE